jgi:hypothetical protein
MANKQIKDFNVVTNGTGSSILIQNDTTGTYNKISAENIASAATVLTKAITAQENIIIKKQLILDSDTNDTPPPPPFIVKSSGTNLNGSDAGIIELDFTGDISGSEVWGIKIKDGSEAWGIKADGKAFAHHVIAKYEADCNCFVPAVRYISNGNNWNNTDVGVFEADLTTDLNITSGVWGIKIKSGSDAWGIKANGDAVVRNFEANTLDSNQLNLVDMNTSFITDSTILMSNHGGGYSPAAWEIQNSEGATSMTFPPDILNRKYTSMASASLGGVPLGGAYIEVDSLTNPTTARLSYRLT